MGIETALAAGRAHARRTMRSTCIIGPESPTPKPDPETAKHDRVITPVYAGPCDFDAGSNAVQDGDSAGRPVSSKTGILAIPVDDPGSPLVQEGHVALIVLEGGVVVRATVGDADHQTNAVKRRLPVEVTT